MLGVRIVEEIGLAEEQWWASKKRKEKNREGRTRHLERTCVLSRECTGKELRGQGGLNTESQEQREGGQWDAGTRPGKVLVCILEATGSHRKLLSSTGEGTRFAFPKKMLLTKRRNGGSGVGVGATVGSGRPFRKLWKPCQQEMISAVSR